MHKRADATKRPPPQELLALLQASQARLTLTNMYFDIVVATFFP